MSSKNLFLNKTLEHFDSAHVSLQKLDFRNFISRFYYGYINLLWLLGMKQSGDWHKESSYNFPSESFRNIWQQLRIWRIRADYEYEASKSFSLYEKELEEFLEKELVEHIEDELIPLIKENCFFKENFALQLLVTKKLEGINRWLKIILQK